MSLSLVTPPSALPFSLSDAQLHLRVDGDDDSDLIQALQAAVTERCEAETQRALITQTWDWVLDAFPAATYLELPKPPLQSVTFIRYVDMAGVTQTWSPSLYLVQAPAGPRATRGRIALPFSGIWPIALPQMGAVTIRFVCGYGAAQDDIPASLLAAMKLDLGTLYENREGVVVDNRIAANELPQGVKSIYVRHRAPVTQAGVAA
jgi:uncharacterized phiE125 gp8 family phage protein